MDRNNTATDAVGSAVAKLLHIAMRQQQAAWWLRYAPGRQTSDLLAELAGRVRWPDGCRDAEDGGPGGISVAVSSDQRAHGPDAGVIGGTVAIISKASGPRLPALATAE